MKAIICTKYGPPEVLKTVNIDKPVPKENEVLIKIIATTVTSGDCRVRGFNVPASFWLPAKLSLGFFRPKQPILGSELSGIIEAVDKNVQKFKIGDKIFAATGHNKMGTYAEYKCMDEKGCIALKPENLSFEQAAALSFGGATALHFLKKGNLIKGEKILIYGASGCVGTYAVQLAKYFGAEVTGVCSTENLELVKSIGAGRVVDYTKTDIADLNEKFDVVFDTVGKTNISKTKKIIKPHGRYIHTVTTPFTEIKIRLNLFGSKIKLVGGTFSTTPEQINFIKKLADEGFLKPVIDRQYSLDEIVLAHRYVDTGQKKGNVVIKVSEI
jgi:NADPH:quinone reductase-like Zn-dependent oxidoreductase